MNYKAFISYSHADQKIAVRLHSLLENYKPPKSIRTEFHMNDNSAWQLRPIFLDREELSASPQLPATLQEALENSQALIVICSPNAVKSKWVNLEIQAFREMHPNRPILAFVVAGDPSLNPFDDQENAAFPVSLISATPDDSSGPLIEPLAADARKIADGFKVASLRLIAGLLDVKFDQLRQRELKRQQKRMVAISAAAVGLAIAFGIIALQAIEARKEADKARKQAEIELTTERQTREFLLSVFQLADPNEARGNEVTVREVLDKSVSRIARAEFSSTLIKAKLTSTMAQAYANLGLNQRGLELFDNSSRLFDKNKPNADILKQKTSNMLSSADISYTMGNYDKALKFMDNANVNLANADQASIFDQIRALNIKGDILSYKEEDAAAEKSYLRALTILDTSTLSAGQDASERSRSLGGLALLAHFQGATKKSEELFREAGALLSENFGDDHPDSIWASSSLASAAYLNGNIELAQSTWEDLVVVATKVLGEKHPEIATIRNSLGLLALERGNFVKARAELEEAIAVDRASRTELFDDLVYPLTNLAYVNIFEEKYTAANVLLVEAAEISTKSNHRWRGTVANHQADVACSEKKFTKGIQLAEEAIRDVTEEFGEEDWRVEQAKMTRFFCQASAGEKIDVIDVEKVLKRITQKWGDSICYTQRAIEQAKDIYMKIGDQPRAESLIARKLDW